MGTLRTEILQATATISKTTETLVGNVIDVTKAKTITLFMKYVKGDETGLYVVPYVVGSDATEYQLADWATSGGLYTGTVIKFQFTATANRAVVIEVEGFDSIKIYQGGSNNDGTPTGTLAVAYTLKD